MSIGTKIRDLRKARGLTQEQVAAAIGYQSQRFQNGKATMDTRILPCLLLWHAFLKQRLTACLNITFLSLKSRSVKS